MRPNRDPCSARIGEHDLHAFVDGVLEDERRADFLAYLAAHPLEAEKVNALFRQREALAALRDALTPPDDATFAPGLQRRLRGALLRQRLFRGGTRIAAALAVALPLAAAAWWISTGAPPVDLAGNREAAEEPRPGPVFPFGKSLSYVDDGTVESGGASLARLAGHVEGGALGVPDLTGLGFRLVGSEAVGGVDPPAARLVYVDDRAHQLLVYVGIYSERSPQAFTLVPEGHLSLHWRKGPLVFAVVGPIDMPLLLEVMRSVSTGVTAVAEAPAPPPGVGDVKPAVVLPQDLTPAAPTPPLPGDAGSPAVDPAPLGKEEAQVL
jgi:anti-sigma factor RsiW